VVKKDVKAAVITMPVRGQQHQSRKALGNGMVPWAAGTAEEQTMDNVQPGKVAGRIGHLWGHHVRVTPGADETGVRVGGCRAIKMTWQTIQWGVREVATAKHVQDCSICRSGLQVPLSAEQEGIVRYASERAATVKDVLIQVLGNAASGGPGRK
jgi:glutamate-1-semialdehyde aminotransferase